MAEAKIEQLYVVVRDNLAGGWAGNTDAQVQAWLDGTVTQQRDVDWENFMVWVARYDMINELEAAKTSNSLSAIQNSAAAYLLTHANAGMPVRMSDSEVRSFLNQLVPAVISTVQRDDFLTFSDFSVTRAVFYGVTRKIGAIARARELSL